MADFINIYPTGFVASAHHSKVANDWDQGQWNGAPALLRSTPLNNFPPLLPLRLSSPLDLPRKFMLI